MEEGADKAHCPAATLGAKDPLEPSRGSFFFAFRCAVGQLGMGLLGLGLHPAQESAIWRGAKSWMSCRRGAIFGPAWLFLCSEWCVVVVASWCLVGVDVGWGCEPWDAGLDADFPLFFVDEVVVV